VKSRPDWDGTGHVPYDGEGIVLCEIKNHTPDYLQIRNWGSDYPWEIEIHAKIIQEKDKKYIWVLVDPAMYNGEVVLILLNLWNEPPELWEGTPYEFKVYMIEEISKWNYFTWSKILIDKRQWKKLIETIDEAVMTEYMNRFV